MTPMPTPWATWCLGNSGCFGSLPTIPPHARQSGWRRGGRWPTLKMTAARLALHR